MVEVGMHSNNKTTSSESVILKNQIAIFLRGLASQRLQPTFIYLFN